MLLTGVGTAAALWLLGVPMPITIGIATGLLTFVPNIGAVIALVLDSAWGVAAGSARSWFADRPTRQRRMNLASGLTMIGLGALLVTTGQSE